MDDSQYLEEASKCTTRTEFSAHVSNTVEITSELVYSDYDAMLDDDSVIDEILITGATC